MTESETHTIFSLLETTTLGAEIRDYMITALTQLEDCSDLGFNVAYRNLREALAVVDTLTKGT